MLSWKAAVLLFTAASAAAAADPGGADEIRVAVQTIGESAAIVETAATTLDHLRDELPGRRFILEYYDRTELSAVVRAAREPILFLTDAVTFAGLEKSDAVRAVASMKEPHALDAEHTAGAAFIVRADREDLKSLSDLRGQTAEAAERSANESYIIGMHEIRRIFGEAPFFGETKLVAALSEVVVHDVAARQADVGIVEACLLEEMEAKGNIPRGLLRVVGERSSRDLRCRHSTELYPGWVLGLALPSEAGANDLASKWIAELAPVLATVPKLAGTYEWTAPSDSQAVAALLEEWLRGEKEFDFPAFIRAYGPYAAVAGLVFLAVLLHGFYVSWLVRRRTRELERAMREKETLRRLADEERERMSTLERAGIAGQLSSMIAHELTQPLNAVVNYARGLRIRHSRKRLDDSTLDETLARISDQGMMASEIVNRVRGYAKNGETKDERCDLARLLAQSVERFRLARPQAPRPVILSADSAPVEGHPMELSLLIHNLLKNADEACRGVPNPRIEAAVTTEAELVRLTVSDNGPEISGEALSRLFEPLHTTKAGGLGLGLSICRSIAESHGGRIEAAKDASGRLTFVLELPRAKSAGETS